MSDYLIHECPLEDYEQVHVHSGHPCQNGCGWIAHDGDIEEFAVTDAMKAINLWGPWLHLGDAANKSGVAFSTIAQATREGRLPFLQIGRQKFVRLSAVKSACSNVHGRRPVQRIRARSANALDHAQG